MIFATVGSQMPFDRMIQCIDNWAAEHPEIEIFAQIGNTNYRPKHMKWVSNLTPHQYKETIQASNAIVSHAGMGTILNALESGKRILVLPRRADLRETRNDHQIATAKHFQEKGSITVAFDEEELTRRMLDIMQVTPAPAIRQTASDELLFRLREFLDSF